MIRPATLEDIPALMPLAMEALQTNGYLSLVPSEAKISGMLAACIGSVTHFGWVSEREGEIMGAIGAMVEPLAAYERNQAQVVMWYCKQPGDGMRLMRQFLAWAKQRPMIKQIVFGMERKADPRIAKLIHRAGFEEALPTFVLTR